MLYYFIDESGSGFSTSGIAILSCIVIHNPIEIRGGIAKLKNDILHNQRFTGILKNFSMIGFHYSDDHIEIKNEFISFLKTLTFNAYICFAKSINSQNTMQTYNNLFGRLIFERLRANRNEELEICYEQYSSSTASHLIAIKNLINTKISEINLSERNTIKCEPMVRCANKGEDLLAIADYVCGIFGAYLKTNEAAKDVDKSMEKRNFDDIRGKVRCIHDITEDKFYDRRNPFP